MNKLLSYWPKTDEVNRCIKTEAETASDAVLLSVHQDTPLSVRNAGSSTTSKATEVDLLDAFLTPDLPEGTLLLPITGASGVGKSHMIRWLAAHLERDARASNMHVIRIPKSASLRTVVELILEPLHDNDQFAKARKELEEAVSSVNPRDGAIHFAANLEVALEEEAKIFEGMIREDPNRADKRELKANLDHAKKLPRYFNDAALADNFKGGILPKIVERAIVGKDEDEEEKFPQFAIDDLKLPDEIELGNAAKEVQLYHQTVLQRGEDDEGYKRAVEVLNSVVDKAIRNLFRLNQAMGGVTLEEIVLQIRTLLMKEEKELVLLIEDFAALSGIQEVLLSVCIQEAVRDGKKVRSPMRTALAVTDGYLANRDTILTRAKREWIVESNLPTPEDVLKRTTRLVGAYLNAARWGEEALTDKFEKSRKDMSSGLTDWIETYRDDNETPEEADLLKSFGDVSGVPLFPFNSNALRILIEDKLQVGGSLQFNPRKIINHIIRDILLLREAFQNQSFPLDNFSARSPKTGIASWIASHRLGTTIEGRLGQATIYWAGNPENPEEIGSAMEGIFKAFDLPLPSGLGVDPPSDEADEDADRNPRVDKEQGDQEKEDKNQQPSPKPPARPTPEDKYIRSWRETLENWVGGQRLVQAPANELRNAIASALNRAIDWNGLLMRPVPVTASRIELPNALGNPSGNKKLVLASNTNDPHGILRKTVLALLRFTKMGETWSYPEADEDTALIANLIERLIPEYIALVKADISAVTVTLATVLARQAQVLGTAPRRIVGRQSIVDAVFSPAPELLDNTYPPTSPEFSWRQVEIEAIKERDALQEALTDKIGARQGTGGTVYAIDVSRLQLSNEDALRDGRDNLTSAQREHVGDMAIKRLRARAKAVAREITKTKSLCDATIGNEFEKQDVYEHLRDLVVSAQEAAIWPTKFPLKSSQVRKKLDGFRDAPITETVIKMNELSKAIGDENEEEVIHIIGRIDFLSVDNLKDYLTTFAQFLAQLDQEIGLREHEDTGMTVTELVNANQEVLDELKMAFSALKIGSEES